MRQELKIRRLHEQASSRTTLQKPPSVCLFPIIIKALSVVDSIIFRYLLRWFVSFLLSYSHSFSQKKKLSAIGTINRFYLPFLPLGAVCYPVLDRINQHLVKSLYFLKKFPKQKFFKIIVSITIFFYYQNLEKLFCAETGWFRDQLGN